MTTIINGREMRIEALAAWLEQLPDDFLFARTGEEYTCECLLGRYFNPDGAEVRVGVAFTAIDLEHADGEVRVELNDGMLAARELYDYLAMGRENVTAKRLREAIVAYLLFR